MKELIRKCRERVARIEAHGDEGLYAKAYAHDVTKLADEVERLQKLLNSSTEGEDCFRL